MSAEPYAVVVDARHAPPVDDAARTLGLSVADARLLTAGDLPRLVRVALDGDLARRQAQELGAAGGRAISCRAAPLFAADVALAATTLTPQGREMSLAGAAGSLVVDAHDVALIVAARTSRVLETTAQVSERRLNLGATLATGGIPIHKRVQETVTQATGVDDDMALWLFAGERVQPVACLRAAVFDARSLGERRRGSTLANFLALGEWLEKLCPRAVWDRRLFRPGMGTAAGPATMDYGDAGFQLATARMMRLLQLAYGEP